MTKLVNRAKMTTATTGTGTITLGSAVDAYQTFAVAGVSDGDIVRYVIEDGSDWEIGTGTYTASGTTLSRTVSESSNAGSAISLSGDAVVFVSATEADLREERVGSISGATLDLSTGNVFSYTPTEDTTFVFSNPPASGTAQGFTLKVTGDEVTVAYDIANASYDSVSFSVSSQDSNPIGVAFGDSGAKMYVLGTAPNTIYQYTLSTAFDLSTASYDSVSFSVSSEETSAHEVVFRPDGTKMYIIGPVSDAVQQYTLGTAWDISTASYDSVSFDVSPQSSTPRGLAFKPDGTRMYVVGDSFPRRIYQYTLGTAWDVSTASYDSVSLGYTGFAEAVVFNSNGLELYLLKRNNESVEKYTLSTPWDLSSGSYSGTDYSFAAQDIDPRGLRFNTDGTKMYMVGYSDSVYQYTTGGSTFTPTFTYPASVKWPSGLAPDAPAVGETDVLTFYTQDGGTTYYGLQAGDNMA